MSLQNNSLIKNRNVFYKIKKDGVFWLMMSPSLFLLLLLSYVPMLGLVVAFKEYNFKDGIIFSPWNGLKNFKFFFISGKAGLIVTNTILYNLVFLICGTIASVFLAILISEIGGKYYKKITQSAIFLPYFMSWVVISTMVYNLLNYDYGTFNNMRKAIGMSPMDIYSNSSYWYILLPLLKLWKDAGWGSIIYFAAIMGIDQECYESADIDGANIFQKVKNITIPMIVPTIIIMTLLSLGRILRGEFDMFYQLVGKNGLLFNATDIIDTFVFRSLTTSNDMGMAGAAGFFQSVICFTFIVTVNKIVKKVKPDSSLF